MKKEQIITQLKELIEEQTEKRINNNDEDINIDSFTMMLVITFADQKLNIKLDMDTLDFDKFKSLNDLVNLILTNKKKVILK
jgi:acyl carrier protein